MVKGGGSTRQAPAVSPGEVKRYQAQDHHRRGPQSHWKFSIIITVVVNAAVA
jgi:hypothetical protein